MNPACSFGPALLGGTWTAHWAYWIDPVAGAALGALIYGYVRGSSAPGPEGERDPPVART